jgi:hypothetical protein
MSLPVLLTVQVDEFGVILRIDADPESEQSIENAIIIVTVRNRQSESALDELKKGIGKVLEYEALSNEGENILSFTVDYHVDSVDVPCENWAESATIDDLLARTKHLANSFRVSVDQYEQSERRHQRLRSRLQAALTRQQDRTQRKLDFFEVTDAAKAEAMKARLDVLETIRRIVDEEN